MNAVQDEFIQNNYCRTMITVFQADDKKNQQKIS